MKKVSLLFVLFISLFLFAFGVKAAEIKNGVYTIESALSSDMVLDLSGGTIKNGGNIHLYKSNNSNAQRWYVEKLNNGYYQIKSVLNKDYVLDVAGAKKANGANVQLYKSNGSLAQQWLIKDAGNGYFYIVSKCNNLNIDVSGGKAKNGTNIHMYNSNGSKAQKFRFVEVLEKKKTLDNGNYIITTSLANEKAIDIKSKNIAVNSNIEISRENKLWTQKWNVQYLNNGYYKISSMIDNTYVLDVVGAKSISGTNIQLYKYNGSAAQQWLIKDVGNGYYTIVSKIGHDNLYVDVAGASTNDGTNIRICASNGSGAQKFKFIKDDSKFLTDGTYIINNVNNNKNVAIYRSMLTNSSNIILETENNNNSQKWIIKHTGNGYYKISSIYDTNYVLDVVGGVKNDGTNIQLYKSNNSNAQRWYIKFLNGNYVLTSKLGNYSLDIGAVIDESNNLLINTTNDSDTQQFKFIETSKNDTIPNYPDANINTGYYTIKSALNSNMLIDVAGGYRTNGTNIQMGKNNSSLSQIWYIKKQSNGYYTISSALNTRVVFDIYNGTISSGSNVQLWKSNSSNAQLWSIKNIGNGNYSFVPKNDKVALDVATSNVENGTNIFINTLTYGINQQFTLNSYTNKKVYNGIDVSRWQGDIDWEKVSKTKIDFVIIRSGFGEELENSTKYDDAKFVDNVKGCEKYNIPYAVYFYSYATDDSNNDTGAGDEAKHALRLMNKIKASGYSPNLSTKIFYDIEDDSIKPVGKKMLTNIANKFCSTMENKGYDCGIYANASWLNNYLDAVNIAKKYDIWLASWPKKNTITSHSSAISLNPGYSLTSYKLWQFTSQGKLSGISTNVDFDLGYDIFD